MVALSCVASTGRTNSAIVRRMPRLRGERFLLDAPEGRFPPAARIGTAVGVIAGIVTSIGETAIGCGEHCEPIALVIAYAALAAAVGAFFGYILVGVGALAYMLIASLVDVLHRLLFTREGR